MCVLVSFCLFVKTTEIPSWVSAYINLNLNSWTTLKRFLLISKFVFHKNLKLVNYYDLYYKSLVRLHCLHSQSSICTFDPILIYLDQKKFTLLRDFNFTKMFQHSKSSPIISLGLTLNRLGGLNLCIAWGGRLAPPPLEKGLRE